MAQCESGQTKVANRYLTEARASTDDIERLVLVKRSLKACQTFIGWVELGKVQIALDNVADAVAAFESARDVYTPDNNGFYTSSELKRLAIGNAWLADIYLKVGELASASVATQEASRAYGILQVQKPMRLVQLQAEIDDAMASADASVLARTFDLQHQLSTRGIGVRAKVRESNEPPEVLAETDALQAEYDNVPVAVALNTQNSVNPKPEASAAVVNEPTRPESIMDSGTLSESRLNIPVLFEFDSAKLSGASQNSVNQLGSAISALGLDSSASVIVVGHTDSQGDANYNQALSLQRANTVLSAFRTLVSSNPNFEARGSGEKELRYTGSSSDDHRRNRRVEIIVRR